MVSMKHYLPEIVWHNRDAVYCVDFQPQQSSRKYRIVTCGLERDIRIWELKFDEKFEVLEVDFISNLRDHQQVVNVVRFSPDGSMLASADIQGALTLWERNDSSAPDLFAADDLPPNKENWTVRKRLRGHQKDISDLCWSPDGKQLASVSVDESIIVFNVDNGQHLAIITDHRRFPNGVCWDPRGRYLATLGVDRELHVYGADLPKFKRLHRVAKASLPALSENASGRLFHDDSIFSFTRHLTFSPDGEFLIVPAGCIEKGKTIQNATHIFSRRNFESPCVVLTGFEKPTVAVSCCPVLFELKKSEENLLGLPYRFVFAVISYNSAYLYDSQHSSAIALAQNIHYAHLSALSWSDDGELLVVSSQDGYCSVFRFPSSCLGVPLSQPPKRPASPVVCASAKTPKSGQKRKVKNTPEVTPGEGKTPKRSGKSPTLLKWLQPTDTTPKSKTPTPVVTQHNNTGSIDRPSVQPRRVPFETVAAPPANAPPAAQSNENPDAAPKPRRVTFVTLS